ncbi:MAG: 1-deoxy-D-xylulose-5-phosphate reductoisomerase [Lachnospiraceae bacterium]|nr:1-deoxy-D-xylulose-5-phosphate reductoisomerase [Lachnospiraceae bacterium]
MKNISILGSTGSIGKQTLEIVDENPGRFRVVALTANKNADLLYKQIKKYKPLMVCLFDADAAKELKWFVSHDPEVKTEIYTGMDGLMATAVLPEADVVVTAVVGMIGIKPTIAAIKAGKDIALANKETLVTAGHIIMPLIKKYGVNLLPVDSEHSAIFQSLQTVPDGSSILRTANSQIEKIILTCSGGPFRGKSLAELASVRKEDALKHPNWSMGSKITIDSSTLVNKGLEVMEAGWLYGMPSDKIQVVIHPQSVLHSAVEFIDGAVIGQMGCPDMKLPILYALTYPDRVPLSGKKLDFYELSSLDFYKPDMETFVGLKLAYAAMNAGGSMPTVYNAANEYLVSKFLADEIGYLDITKYIAMAMEKHVVIPEPDVDTITELKSDIELYLSLLLNSEE